MRTRWILVVIVSVALGASCVAAWAEPGASGSQPGPRFCDACRQAMPGPGPVDSGMGMGPGRMGGSMGQGCPMAAGTGQGCPMAAGTGAGCPMAGGMGQGLCCPMGMGGGASLAVAGKFVYIAQGGVLYKINAENMEVVSQVAYLPQPMPLMGPGMAYREAPRLYRYRDYRDEYRSTRTVPRPADRPPSW